MKTRTRKPPIIGKPCVDCGRRTTTGSRCGLHEKEKEVERQARQPYRAVYRSALYQKNRRIRIKRAGGRCERVINGFRCSSPAQETHHVIPLSTATTLAQALLLCNWRNLEAVCWRHNPRGSGVPLAGEASTR